MTRLLALLLLAWPACAATIPVTTSAELNAAMAKAQSGDVIALAPGRYDGFAFKPPAAPFVPAVTITSADPARPAVLTDFSLGRFTGLHFRQIELQALPPAVPNTWAFRIAKAGDVAFDQVHVHGSLDGDAANDAYGLSLREIAGVSVTRSEFQQLGRALALGTGTDVEVSGNYAHDLRSDAFDFADVQRVKITANVVRNIRAVAPDHPDAIQFWTSGTTRPSTDILIGGNVLLRGEGKGTQGIFLRDQVGTLPYERVTITDNLLVGTGYNGIRIQGVRGLTLTRNELVTQDIDKDPVTGKLLYTNILVQGGDGIVSRDNRAYLIGFDKPLNLQQSGDVITRPVSDLGAAALARWIANRSR